MIARPGSAAALLCLLALPAGAQEDAGPAPLAGALLKIELGETRSLGIRMGTPVTCDDGTLVERTVAGDFLALRGVKLGETLCSVLTATFTTVRYRVQVVEPPPARPPARPPPRPR